MENKEFTREVEAILFAASKWMQIDDIAKLLETRNPNVVDALNLLKKEYDEKKTALIILNEEDRWKISLKNQYMPLSEKLMPSTELSKSVVETLAIIAWKTPILQADLVKIRSPVVYEHIMELEKLKLIVKIKHGRSYIIKVSDKFYDYFDIPKEQAQEMFEEFIEPIRIEENKKEGVFNKGDSFDESVENTEKRLLEEIKNNKIDPKLIIDNDKDFLSDFDKKLKVIEDNGIFNKGNFENLAEKSSNDENKINLEQKEE